MNMRLLVMLALLSTTAFANEPLRVENVRFDSYQPGWVAVYYDLLGEPGKYTVDLTFRSVGDKGQTIKPASVQQDVGKGVQPGRSKRILWRVEKDYPEGLPTDQFVAQVTAKKPGKLWPWLAGGGAIVGGGVAAMMIQSNSEDEPSTGTLIISLPDHP
jgi:hypothetical protein